MKLNALREQRSRTVTEMKNLVDKAAAENRDLSAEEIQRFDTMKTEERSLGEQIARLEYVAEIERRAAGTQVAGPESNDFNRLAGSVSVMRVLQAQLEGRRLDGAEAEYSREAERRSGRKASGIYIPMRTVETRATTTTTAPEIVGTDHRADQYINPLRNRLLARQLGVRVLDGLSGDVSIPKHGTGLSTGWVAEGSAVGDGDMTFDPVTLTPKHVGGKTEMSRQLIQQSSPAIEQLVRDDLAFLIAQSLDSAIIAGTGAANDPTGIINNGSIQTHSLATLDHISLLEMIEKLELVNAEAMHWLGGTSVKKMLASTLKAAGIAGYLLENGMCEDVPFFSTNQLANKSGAPDTGRLILGDFSQVLLGVWSEIDLLVNPYAEPAYSRGGVVVRAMSTADVAIRHPQGFVLSDDVAL